MRDLRAQIEELLDARAVGTNGRPFVRFARSMPLPRSVLRGSLWKLSIIRVSETIISSKRLHRSPVNRISSLLQRSMKAAARTSGGANGGNKKTPRIPRLSSVPLPIPAPNKNVSPGRGGSITRHISVYSLSRLFMQKQPLSSQAVPKIAPREPYLPTYHSESPHKISRYFH